MKTIHVDGRSWKRAKKNGWHRCLYDDAPGLPMFDGEKVGDEIRLSWRESLPQEWFLDVKITDVERKDNCVILRFDEIDTGEIHHPDDLETERNVETEILKSGLWTLRG